VTRLTIIVPYSVDRSQQQRGVELLEDTLVSVLEHRPPSCQLIVAHDGSYADPYALQGEVEYLVDRGSRSRVDLINHALPQSTSEIAHILAPGVLVKDDWSDGVEQLFRDSRVASASPCIVRKDAPDRLVHLGLEYGGGGARLLVAAGRTVSDKRCQTAVALGPSLTAGFYRVDSVLAAGGFAGCVGDELADLDMALTLHARGFRSVVAGSCRVVADGESDRAAGFHGGRCLERLFWRHLNHHGLVRSFVAHPLSVLGRAVGDIPHPGSVLQLFGRTLAWLEWSTHRQFRLSLQAAETRKELEEPAATLSIRDHQAGLSRTHLSDAPRDSRRAA